MSVTVSIPYDFVEQVMAELQPRIDAALKIAEQVEHIIKEKAVLDNEDVEGNQFPQKKPVPKANPKNLPNVALIQNDTPDEMNPARWSVDQVGLTEIHVLYQPSDHHDYLVNKDPQNGGRKWLTHTEMNKGARDEIERLMAEAMEA